MSIDRRPQGLSLIAAGLIGMSLYYVTLRFPHPEALSADLVRGLWVGACLGLEILGLLQLRRRGPSHAA